MTSRPASAAKAGKERKPRTFGTVTMMPDGTFLMGRRKVMPPTLKRSVKRAMLFLPIGFALGFFFVKQHSIQSATLLALAYTVAAIPITYWTDRMSYRRLARKFEDAGGSLPAADQ